MSYVGGKHRLRKPIAGLIMRECARLETREVWEPFCGGLHITAELGRRGVSVHASDLSRAAITYYRAIRFGWEPPKGGVTRAQWETLKLAHQAGESSPMISFAGFSCSFNGIFFASYDGADRTAADGGTRRPLSRYLNLRNRVAACSFASLECKSFDTVRIPPRAVVYCDPPYANTDTSAYRSLTADERQFDHAAFWTWCRGLALRGAAVLVSEYTAPDDVECIWAREVPTSSKHHTGSAGTAVERVFRIREP